MIYDWLLIYVDVLLFWFKCMFVKGVVDFC